VEVEAAERRQNRHRARLKDEQEPGGVGAIGAARQPDQTERSEEEQRQIVGGDRAEEPRKVGRQVAAEDRSDLVGPSPGEGRQDAVVSDLRRERGGEPGAAQGPVAQERQKRRGGGGDRDDGGHARPQRPRLEQVVQKHHRRKEHQLRPGQGGGHGEEQPRDRSSRR